MINIALVVISLMWVQQPPAAAVLPTDPRFEATLIDGTKASGKIGGLILGPDGSGTITLVDDQPRAIEWTRIVKLCRLSAPTARPKSVESLFFSSGENLRGNLRSADADSLEFAPALTPSTPIRVPLPKLRGVLINPPDQESALTALAAVISDPNREGDAVWLTNGDRRAWSLLGYDRDRLRFDAEMGPAELERPNVAAIGFDPALADPVSDTSPYWEVILGDGSRLGLTGATLEKGMLQVQTRSGLSLQLRLDSVVEGYVRGGAVVYLTEREPAAREFVAYLDRHPGRLGLDTTWDGAGLSVLSRSYAHGLGMLPRTLVVYRIEPGDKRFQTLLGIDDRAGDQASVVFRILLDRREAFVSPAMTRQAAPIPVDLDLQGARLLVLITEFGERGDVQDHADWIEARIIRSRDATPPNQP